MNWSDIACIVFVAVTINHLGLIAAIEQVIGRGLPIVHCPKCLSFWLVMICGTFNVQSSMFNGQCSMVNVQCFISLLALSLLSSYMAIWLELIEGFIDVLYHKIYEQIYSTTNTTTDHTQRT